MAAARLDQSKDRRTGALGDPDLHCCVRGDFGGAGRQLIDDIWTFATGNDADCTYVHNWSVGDLLIWDNLMLQHARLPFDSNEPRTLRRTPIV
jgi:hypothetical protein